MLKKVYHININRDKLAEQKEDLLSAGSGQHNESTSKSRITSELAQVVLEFLWYQYSIETRGNSKKCRT